MHCSRGGPSWPPDRLARKTPLRWDMATSCLYGPNGSRDQSFCLNLVLLGERVGVKGGRPVLHSKHSLVTYRATVVSVASQGSYFQILSITRSCSQTWTYAVRKPGQHASVL